jgi:hypothetical protein
MSVVEYKIRIELGSYNQMSIYEAVIINSEVRLK